MANVQVFIEKTFSMESLEKEWLSLEKRNHVNIFQTWIWTKHWLSVLPESYRPFLIKVIKGDDNQVVGLCLLGKNTLFRKKVFKSRSLFMHESGYEDYDVLTPEYIAPLVDKEIEKEVNHAIVQAMMNEKNWDELNIHASCKNNDFIEVAKENNLFWWVTSEGVSWQRELSDMQNKNIMETLSKNTSYQIRRSKKYYESIGELKIEVADSQEDVQQYLEHLEHWHQAYWVQKGRPGSFASSVFKQFHYNLCQEGLETGQIKLMRCVAGNYTIGYLYNFFHDQVMYAYQSGFNYEPSQEVEKKVNKNTLKPGLVSHMMAIEYAQGLGAVRYDFLAGDSQYKRSLSDAKTEMQWGRLQRPRLSLLIERKLRKIMKKM